MELIERRRLWGKGIGWVDANVLAPALLSGYVLWTLDKRLLEAATLTKVPRFRKTQPN